MAKRLICCIDGEFFEVTFPTVEIWREMFQEKENPEIMQFLKRIRCPLIMREQDQHGFLNNTVIWSSAEKAKDENAPEKLSDIILCSERTGNNHRLWEISEPKDKVIPYLPMLIPLDSSLNNVSEQFQKENPNGTKVYGGSFYVQTPDDDGGWNESEEVQKTVFWHVEIDMKWEIWDTGKDQLEWFVWDGKLICQRYLFMIYPEDLLFFFACLS